ncbi:MAG: aminopeptidase P N-terminal domain-containing protein, partial [Leptospiraceae bacterium]|nr:aminopeptidase P N-terminal domain-containing protein [Leptospiraceae bacterium]
NKIRNKDVEYKFRQDSDFYYLTGIEEPDAILILKNNYSAIFALPKNKEKEIWTGIRLGKEKIKQFLQLTESFDLQDWGSQKERLFTNEEKIFYFFGKDKERDNEILTLCDTLNKKLRDGNYGPEKIEFPSFLHEMRLIKSKEEIDCIRESIRITKLGHLELMKKAKYGMIEFELEAILESEYIRQGAWGGGYGHIVASGKNATILHYTKNNSVIQKNDLILVDSGAEKNYYTADVTRVFPAGKKFTTPQKEIYSLVLIAQKEAISLVTKNRRFSEIHEKTVYALCEGLKDLNLLKGSISQIIETESYKKFFMHKTGHWLGLDVHDVGKYYIDGKSRRLEDGQVTTIEPGLYFDASDNSIPKHFRGIGIRIEDDILVNGKNPINLTKEIPKEIEEIEDLREV